MYISVVETLNNRIRVCKKFNILTEAQQHCDKHGGFVYNNSNNYPINELHVDGETVTHVSLPPEPTIYTPSEFFDLFTKAEWKGIKAAAKNNDDVEYWMDKLRVVQSVNVGHSDTIAGINQLVAGGLLTQARADEILNG